MRVGPLSRKALKTVAASAAVASIEKRLLENGFLVVLDQDRFRGIVTPLDIVRSPRGLVGDCVRRMPRLNYDDEVESALVLLRKGPHSALPVFREHEFVGVITSADIADHLLGRGSDLERALAERTAELSKISVQLQAVAAARSKPEEPRWGTGEALERRAAEPTDELSAYGQGPKVEGGEHEHAKQGIAPRRPSATAWRSVVRPLQEQD